MLNADDSVDHVNELATKNSPHIIYGRPPREKARKGSIHLPEESQRIHAKVRELAERCEFVWRDLVSHLTDNRHCGVVGMDAGYPRNWTVGDVCQELIGRSLSAPYYQHLPRTKRNYHRFYIPQFAKDRAQLKQWCEERKNRKLYELQMEACEWAIHVIEAKNDFDPGLGEQQTRDVCNKIRTTLGELKRTRTAIDAEGGLDIH
jgi:hypothetical protein